MSDPLDEFNDKLNAMVEYMSLIEYQDFLCAVRDEVKGRLAAVREDIRHDKTPPSFDGDEP